MDSVGFHVTKFLYEQVKRRFNENTHRILMCERERKRWSVLCEKKM